MKKILLLIMMLSSYMHSYSQESPFKSFSDMLGSSSEQILDIQHISVANKVFNTRLRKIDVMPNGGFNVYYSTEINGVDNGTNYEFNRQKKLISIIYIQDIENRDDQIEYFLSNGFYRYSPYKYYHKELNLMVEVSFNEKFVSFIYTRKPIKTILKK